MANPKAAMHTLFFASIALAALAQTAFADAPVCSPTQFSSTMLMCGIGALTLLTLVALVYMGGEFMQSPRMNVWAKSEALQAFASLAIVSVLIFFIGTACVFRVGELSAMFGNPMPKIYSHTTPAGNDSLYDGALRYVENLAALSLSNVNSLRYDLAAYEIRTSYAKYQCTSKPCLFSLSSWQESSFGGESIKLAITNNLMGVATVSYLSVIFQYFVLLYIFNGLFMVFLPIAIVIRSIPFMRHFGGSLIGIIMALYLVYPLMIVVDAHIASGLASPSVAMRARDSRGCGGMDVFSAIPPKPNTGIICDMNGKTELDIQSVGSTYSKMEALDPTSTVDSIRLNVLIFLTAIFLPALNFIVVAAFGRDVSRFLGEEADIARLGQMI